MTQRASFKKYEKTSEQSTKSIEHFCYWMTIKKYESMVNEFEDENAPIDHVARARENAKIEGFTR